MKIKLFAYISVITNKITNYLITLLIISKNGKK